MDSLPITFESMITEAVRRITDFNAWPRPGLGEWVTVMDMTPDKDADEEFAKALMKRLRKEGFDARIFNTPPAGLKLRVNTEGWFLKKYARNPKEYKSPFDDIDPGGPRY